MKGLGSRVKGERQRGQLGPGPPPALPPPHTHTHTDTRTLEVEVKHPRTPPTHPHTHTHTGGEVKHPSLHLRRSNSFCPMEVMASHESGLKRRASFNLGEEGGKVGGTSQAFTGGLVHPIRAESHMLICMTALTKPPTTHRAQAIQTH